MKSCNSDLLWLFLKKIIPKFLEKFKKTVHDGEWLKQSCTNNVAEMNSRNE